jgi:hypothetical protein
LSPLKSPEGQQELLAAEEQREGSGQERSWIIPLSSRAIDRTDAPGLRKVELSPCAPSEAEKILRKNIHGVVSAYLNQQVPGNRLTQSKMLYRRMRLICNKPVDEMKQSELEQVWLWVCREYREVVK